MDRRTFLQSLAVSSAFLLSGCEKRKKEKLNAPVSAPKKTALAAEPFTRALAIPKELNFGKIQKASLEAMSSKIPVFPGGQADVLTFSGFLPGPTIRIEKGAEFALDFVNKLPDPTIIHWHGLKVPESMDGHPRSVIKTGETKQYRYTVNQRAGTFWYHTHPHGRTGREVYHGLAGMYIIEDEEEKSLGLPSGEFDIPLMIQDKRFDEKGGLVYKETENDNFGVLGDVMLVNWVPFPYHDVKTRKYRLRILNASSARTYRLAFDGIGEFALIGTDGGLMEEPVMLESLILGVAERVDIVVDFGRKNIGDIVTLKSLGLKEASNLPLDPKYPVLGEEIRIMQFRVTQKEEESSPLPSMLSNIPRLQESDALRSRTITMEIMEGGVWTLNKKPYDMDRIDEHIKLGSTEIWEIKNTAHMAHPFHIHGIHFQVLGRNGKFEFPTDRGWKDTVLVMPFETVRIIAKFDNPGLFVHHCHILEHEDQAMMGNFMVE